MNSQTLLHRQVHPSFVRNDRVTSQAFLPTSQVFRPTPKDNSLLSVSDGDQISAEQAYLRFIRNPLCKSIGTLSVSEEECRFLGVNAIPDPDPPSEQPDHCFIDFREKSNRQIEKIATCLRNHAVDRDWTFGPTDIASNHPRRLG